ncbi:MAG: hypothetical protein AAGI01_08990, partial [Myxococcota bacterium]
FWSSNSVIDPNLDVGPSSEAELLAQPGFSTNQPPIHPHVATGPTPPRRLPHPTPSRIRHRRKMTTPSSAESLELDLPKPQSVPIMPTAEPLDAYRPWSEEALASPVSSDEDRSRLVMVGVASLLMCVVGSVGLFVMLRSTSGEEAAVEEPVVEEQAEAEDVRVTGTPDVRTVSRFSRKGILYAISKVGWKTAASTNKVEMGTFTQETFPLYRKNAYIEAVLMMSSDGEMLRAFANQTQGPARVVMFDDKAVRLTPKNMQGRAELGELEAALLKYRAFVFSGE